MRSIRFEQIFEISPGAAKEFPGFRLRDAPARGACAVPGILLTYQNPPKNEGHIPLKLMAGKRV
jgi:hypothetical protein